MKVKAYAAAKAGQALTPFEYEAPEPGENEAQIIISHCGICHSDIHLIDNDWQISQYPLIPGHEVVGKVGAVGKRVTHLQPGQRVGVGWQRSSCMSCEWCISGQENLCPGNEPTTATHYGGFASAINVDARFAFPIPEQLPAETAAPLLCGGITVFTPLVIYNAKPTSRVGVVGIGGLGHLALQFASAFGCKVSAFSSSANKEKEAKGFGANDFVVSTNRDAMSAAANSLDMILVTANVDLNWELYLTALRPNGKLCILGAVPKPLSIPAMSLIGGNRSVCGSNIGNRTMIREMLEFAARHNIRAKVEVVAMSSVNEALERVRTNRARYRMVLAN